MDKTGLHKDNIRVQEEFEFLDTLSQGEFRLFSILPGEGAEVVSVVLGKYILDEQKGRYEAISYAWCSTELTDTIICNDVLLKVTASLHSALWQLREEKSCGLIWADAICIHQTDLNEKTQQVRDMTKVYHSAHNVIIWLGSETKLTKRGIEILEILHNKFDCSIGDDTSSSLETPDQLIKAGLPDRQSPDWRAVGDILMRPWFGRVWILREISAATRATMKIGSITTDPVLIIEALVKLAQTHYLNLGLNAEEAQPLFRYMTAVARFGEHEPGVDDVPLAVMLMHSRAFQCSDPRDKFFALLDCTGLDVQNIVDYHRTLKEVIQDVAEYNVRSRSTLSKRHEALFMSLSYVDDGEMSDSPPSWCPTYAWSEQPLLPMVRGSSFLREQHWRAGIEQEMIVDGHNRLILRGSCIDYVSHYVEIPSLLYEPVHKLSINGTLNQSKYWESIRRNLEYLNACENLVAQQLKDLCEADRLEMYLQCLSLDTRGEHETKEELFQKRNNAYQAFKMAWMISYEDHLQHTEKDVDRMQAICKKFPTMQKRLLEYGAELQPYHALQRLLYELVQEAAYIWKIMQPAFHSRKFGVTSGGRIGFIPNKAEAGDVVCIFFGCETPFILRPALNRPQSGYRLIGNCYLEGLMWGAAFKHTGEEESIKIV